MSIDESPCPACQAPPGALRLDMQLVADPLGSFSLAGVMPKFTARYRPVLTCTGCLLRRVGDFDPDGRHVTFAPPGTTPPDLEGRQL